MARPPSWSAPLRRLALPAAILGVLGAATVTRGGLAASGPGRDASVAPGGVTGGLSAVTPVDQVADTAYGALADVLERLGVPGAHRMGLTGSGIRIGILDGAFLSSHQTLRSIPVVATRDFVDGDDDVGPGADPSLANDGTAVWSLAGGRAPGLLVAPAFGSPFVLARTRSPGGLPPRADALRWVQGLVWLESQGARIVLTGYGFRAFADGFVYPSGDLDGATTAPTVAAREAAGRGVLVVSPMGDLGPEVSTLAAPADAAEVAAVGAVTGAGVVASFSSRGPTGDGRVKPDLLAPGVRVPVAGTASTFDIRLTDGTAASAALLAGAAALFVEAHPERTPEQILAALAASAAGRPEATASPPLPDVGSAVAFPDGIEPLPVQEVDGAGTVTTLTPRFTWDVPSVYPPALPVTYTVRVATDSAFANVVLAEEVVGAFSRRLSEPLPPRTDVYWRVDGATAQDIRRRSGASGPLGVPAWVRLLNLNAPGGSSIPESRPTFRWEPFEDLTPPAGPFLYDLSVFNDRDESPVASFSGLTETEFRPPEPLPLNVPLRWRIVARASGAVADTAVSAGPFVVTSSSRPPTTILFQNFPNPFPQAGEPETHIWFDLAEEASVQLSVYDLRGSLVRRLIPAAGCGEVLLPAGMYGREGGAGTDPCVHVRWDGRDDGGRAVEPGVYLLRLRAGGTEGIRRMVYWP